MASQFSEADHERARRAGQAAMAKMAGQPNTTTARPKTTIVKFPALGIRARDGEVTKNEWRGKRLGTLAGAHAEVLDGNRVHNVAAATLTLMPVLALTRRTKGACAFIVFPDGKIHEHKLPGRREVIAAKADAIRFNALAQQTS